MKVCKRGLEIRPCHSCAGYYLGTTDEDGPRCRLTTLYAKTKEDAELLPLDRCDIEENFFCSGGDCEFCEES